MFKVIFEGPDPEVMWQKTTSSINTVDHPIKLSTQDDINKCLLHHGMNNSSLNIASPTYCTRSHMISSD